MWVVVATMFPVGIVFTSDWLVRAAGGLCTVSNVGITAAGVPFSACATWVVVADRNLEKPGDKHLVENILSEIFHARKPLALSRNLKFFNMAEKSASQLPVIQHEDNIIKPLTKSVNWAPFSKFCYSFSNKRLPYIFIDFVKMIVGRIYIVALGHIDNYGRWK